MSHIPTDRIDTTKEREKLGAIMCGEWDTEACGVLIRVQQRLLDALDAERAENERLREVLREILSIPNSEAAQGIMKVFARAALNPEGET